MSVSTRHEGVVRTERMKWVLACRMTRVRSARAKVVAKAMVVVKGGGCFSVLVFVFFLAEETEGVFKQLVNVCSGHAVSD
jgi:hypothetical protein